MPHSRQDIIKAKNDYMAATARLRAILAGADAAFANSERAAVMLVADEEEPLTLTQTKPTIKDLAEKMGG
jgi:hypothetical protein